MEQLDLFAEVQIPLYNRKGKVITYTLVNAIDVPLVEPFRWRLNQAGKGYAVRYIGSNRKGTRQVISMHREILGLPRKYDGRDGDHKNRDSLDNRRENLRIVNHAQNRQNTSAHRGSSSKYRGVFWRTRAKRWLGQVRVHGYKYHIGSFASELEAHHAVVAARRQLMPFSIEN